MATGERFRGGGARGIARFLADHQDHDGGFDVRRGQTQGTGRLRITCEGCGESIDYRAAEVSAVAAADTAMLRENDPTTPSPASTPATAPPRPKRDLPPRRPLRGAPPSAPQPAEEARPWLPGWVATAAIAVLIAGGLVLIAIGLLRGSGGEQTTTPVTPTAAEQQTTQAQAPAQKKTQAQPAPAGGPATTLHRQGFANSFSIGVAPGWTTGKQDGAITLTAPGATAELDVYFQSGERSASELTHAASSFLQSEHPNSQVSAPRTVRLAGESAVEVSADYRGGTQLAVILPSHGSTYLLVKRTDRGASRAIAAEAQAELASFRPG